MVNGGVLRHSLFMSDNEVGNQTEKLNFGTVE